MSIFRKIETKNQTCSAIREISVAEAKAIGGGTTGSVEQAQGAGNATGHVGGGACGHAMKAM